MLFLVELQPLLVASFPTVVGPEPQFGLLADLRFEQADVSLRGSKLLHFLGLEGDDFDVRRVVASAGAADAQVEQGCVHLAGDVFGAREECCLVVEEVRPVVHGFPLRALICDETDDFALSLASVGEYLAEGLLHGNARSTELRAHVEEEVVHLFVLQRMVNLCTFPRLTKPEGEGCHPLPVAVVTQIAEGELLARLFQLPDHLVHARKHDAPSHLRLRHGLHLQRLEYVVAKEVVETVLHLPALLLALFGETICHLSPDQATAVADNVVDKGEKYVIGNRVDHAERETREEAENG